MRFIKSRREKECFFINNINNEFQLILSLGLLSGIVQVITGILMYIAGIYFEKWSVIISVVVLTAMIVYGIRTFKKICIVLKLKYSKLVFVGVIIGFCTALIYAIYNIISISFVYPDFIIDMINSQISQSKEGLSIQEMNDLSVKLEKSITIWTISLSNLAFLSLLSLIISMISSIFLKQQRNIKTK